MTTPSTRRAVLDLFPVKERWRLAGVIGVGMVAAVLETMGVAAILPFMALVLDPSALQRYDALQWVLGVLSIKTEQGALLFVGGTIAALIGIGNTAVAINTYTQQRFSAHSQTRLAATLFEGYLRQPYTFHLHRDGPSLMKIVLYDALSVVNGVVTPFMVASAKLMTAIGVLAIVFLQDPRAATMASVFLLLAYLATYRLLRVKQQKLGADSNVAHLERQRFSQEGLGGVKELQVLGREAHVVRLFHDATFTATVTQARNTTVAQVPRLVIETIAFGSVLIMTLVIIAGQPERATTVVPMLALYAFAGFRLLPCLQQVFGAAIAIRFRLPALLDLHQDYIMVRPGGDSHTHPPPVPDGPRTAWQTLALDAVEFRYPEASVSSLVDLTLTIRRGECIGLVGRTGAGKTTLADVILGVYTPTAGRLKVDDVPLEGATIRQWQRRMGYVPQHVFLANASLAENVAFGVPPEQIDMEAVHRALAAAQTTDFLHTLPEGLNTVLGERGVRLSGGQRQRIGIARALYHDPDILVFDEATSALDGLTESGVTAAIDALAGSRTIILIAHRLRTVMTCDRVVLLDGGRIVAEGPYQHLVETSPEFRHFVGGLNTTADAESAS